MQLLTCYSYSVLQCSQYFVFQSLLPLIGQFSVSVCTESVALRLQCLCRMYTTSLLISVDSLTAEFVYNVVFNDTVLGVTVQPFNHMLFITGVCSITFHIRVLIIYSHKTTGTCFVQFQCLFTVQNEAATSKTIRCCSMFWSYLICFVHNYPSTNSQLQLQEALYKTAHLSDLQ